MPSSGGPMAPRPSTGPLVRAPSSTGSRWCWPVWEVRGRLARRGEGGPPTVGGRPDDRGRVMDYVNSVRLVGRVSAVGEARELPSGDTVHTLRVVVPRAVVARRASKGDDGGRAGVDTIDVACW